MDDSLLKVLLASIYPLNPFNKSVVIINENQRSFAKRMVQFLEHREYSKVFIQELKRLRPDYDSEADLIQELDRQAIILKAAIEQYEKIKSN